MKKMWKAGLPIACMIFSISMVTGMTVKAEEIPNGIYVGEYNLGGMTKEEAEQKVEEYIHGQAEQTITLEIDGSAVDTTAQALGFHWSNTDAVSKTVDLYRGGNLIRRYMNLKDLEKEPVRIALETSMDEEKVAGFVETECNSFTGAPKDAVITRENGKFIITPSEVGKEVDIDATKRALDQAIKEGLHQPVRVVAVVEEAQPARTTEMLSTIQDVLGTFSTDFRSSGASRATNIRVGADKINGMVLMPGETLSGYECMQPFSTKNGYATAGAYENGMVVDSIGGGVCQISTTLYNTALLAEMTITQRQNHSMIVNYVKPSNDAAIAGTYKDLKFTNPYDTPIYVEGYTTGRTLTFTIYGKENRPANRTIKYVSETLGTTDPGEPITKVDPALQPGAKVREQSSHRGIRSRLWKYVYVDGVETEKTILHTDTYNASKAIYRVGSEVPAEPAAPPAAPVAPAVPIETPPTEPEPPMVNEPVTGIHGGPGVSQDDIVPEPGPVGPGGPGE